MTATTVGGLTIADRSPRAPPFLETRDVLWNGETIGRLEAGQGVDGCSYWMPELPGVPDFLSKQGLAIFSLDPARVFIAWGLVLKPSRFMDDCSLSLRLDKEPDAAAREAALTLMRGASTRESAMPRTTVD